MSLEKPSADSAAIADHAVESNALRLVWATLRNSLAPDLGSPLTRDRAKRADAALARLVAGYELLPAVRAAYGDRYAALVAEASALAAAGNQTSGTGHGGRRGPGDIVFVGSPELAARLESLLRQLALVAERDPEIDSRLDRLIREVVATEWACRGDYEQRVLTFAPAAGAGGGRTRDVTREALEEYLRAHPRGSPGLRVLDASEIPGGRSKRTVLARLEPSGTLPTEIVLRLDTGRGVGTSVLGEYPLLAGVARLGLPVPEPLWLEDSGEPFGFPFIVFRRMPGAAAGDLIEGAFRKEPATALALARALARVHSGGAELIADPQQRASSVGHTHELLRHYRDWWHSKKPFPSLVIETAFMWLFRRLGDGLGESTVVHADTGFHNLLLDEAGNGCLLDWEFAHFGDPAEDLASCRPAVEKCMPWEGFMAEYLAHGGLPVSDFRLAYFEIWRPLRNAAVCGTVLHSLMNGEADDIDPVTIALSTFQRLQADLARSLDAVLARAG
jgi:aminoglycoside phosphotransferase (APT) family kinase protein